MRKPTVVPFPRRPTMVTSPSSIMARSRMPSKPRDFTPERSRAVPPLPLSCTSSMSLPPGASNLTLMREASAWPPTSVSVSRNTRNTAVARPLQLRRQRAQLFSRIAQLFFGLLQPGDVARDLGEAQQAPLIVPQRGDNDVGLEAVTVFAHAPAFVLGAPPQFRQLEVLLRL